MIRAYLLEPGDLFRINFSVFKVSKIEDGRIYYHRYYPECVSSKISGKVETMGANSQERLILITNKTKQNEHQN